MKSWVLTDAEKRIRLDSLEVAPKDADLPDAPWSISKTTLHGGLSEGVDLIEVNNGDLSFSILPTRGMGIWHSQYKDLQLGWNSPARGPVHPQFVNLQERGGLGWLAGFDEMVVRCGLDSTGAPGTDTIINNMGVPSESELTLHGKIANIPASRVEVRVCQGNPPELVVIGETYEAALFCPKFRLISTVSTKCGSNSFTITDEITNIGGVETELEFLYHCNFGPPLLEEGARMEIPAAMVAPRDMGAVEGMDSYDEYPGPTAGYVEQCYWFDSLSDSKGRTLAMLRNSSADRAAVVRFNKTELPAFTLWKNTAAESDGYVTGLEPGTSYPNLKTFEREKGRVIKMAPGETRSFTVTIEAHNSKDSVAAVQKEIADLQKTAKRVIHKKPVAEYSPPECMKE